MMGFFMNVKWLVLSITCALCAKEMPVGVSVEEQRAQLIEKIDKLATDFAWVKLSSLLVSEEKDNVRRLLFRQDIEPILKKVSLKITWKTHAIRWARGVPGFFASIAAATCAGILIGDGQHSSALLKEDRRVVEKMVRLYGIQNGPFEQTTTAVVPWESGRSYDERVVMDTTDFERLNRKYQIKAIGLQGLGYFLAGSSLFLMLSSIYPGEKLATYSTLKEIEKILPVRKENQLIGNECKTS